VRITRPYYLAAHETTVGQFRRFVEATQYVTTAERDGTAMHVFDLSGGFEARADLNWANPGFENYELTDSHPVVHVSYDDAVAFCTWLSDVENVTYRLPTEAEWEYACRAGSDRAWSYGGNDEFWNIPNTANVVDSSMKPRQPSWVTPAFWDDGHALTAPVGTFLPNAFGLFDMHGNVGEWCSDFYDSDYYDDTAVDDPQGPADGVDRAVRGGSFVDNFVQKRATRRVGAAPSTATSIIGFRVVREFDSE
jgi:formylglycine-generating enzyme required for sulfatase activity